MAPTLSIKLLGDVVIELNGETLGRFPSRKAELLLAYLVCHDRAFSREHLAELLWAERPGKQAQANLRSILSSLRQKLTPFLIVDRHSIAFNHQSDYQLDVRDFETCLNRVAHHPHPDPGKCKACVAQLRTASNLYRGGFLQGLSASESATLADWALIQHERHSRQALSSLFELTRYALLQGNYAEAQQLALRQLAVEPYREEAYRQLMIALARDGQRSSALAQYQRCREILNRELQVEPATETRTLYQRIRSAGATTPSNLPALQLPLVGRTVAMARVKGQLADPDCRLITLTGPGGVGKTQLALAAARGEDGVFWHGIFFVALASLSEPAELPLAIANAVQCPLDGDGSDTEQLGNFLREKEMLLVLDNFEHLLPAGSHLTQLLAQAPHCKFLVTSRQRLGLQQEQLLALDGLSYPAETDTVSETLPQYGAIQLFLQAASRLQPTYVPGVAEWPILAAICRHVEGLPLALELAAAWTRLAGSETILEQMQRGLDFLTSSSRDRPDRHQSMRLVFQHSWQLLSGQEQAVLCYLALFRAPFNAAAAQAVASADLHLLRRLLGPILVAATRSLITLRCTTCCANILLEQLALRPDRAIAWESYGAHIADFLATQEARLTGGDQLAAQADHQPRLCRCARWLAMAGQP